MANGDVYQARLITTYLGKQTQNVFYYRQVAQGVGDDANQLWNGFNTNVWADIRAILLDTVTAAICSIICINNPSDYYEATLTNPTGAVTDASSLPAWFAAGFRSTWFGPGTRRSYKRFAGIGEGLVAQNSYQGGYATAIADINGALAQTIGNGGSLFEPVQVKSGWTLGQAPVVNGIPSGWNFYGWSTQSSRK